MSNLEFDINHYTFADMLKVFKFTDDTFFNNFKENETYMNNTLVKVKTNFDNNIYIFYVKVFKILTVIHELFIKDNNIRSLCGLLCESIKQIEQFQEKSSDEILEHLNNSNYLGKPLIQQEKTNIVFSTSNSSIAPGKLNSIKRVTQKSNFYLNSMFRQNYTTSLSTNFYYDLPVEVKNVVALSLGSIELPNSWYTISSKLNNNAFNIITNNGGIKKTWYIIVEDGNYTSESLQTYLNSKYFYMSKSYTGEELSNIKFTVDNITAKTIFEIVVPSPSFSFSIFFDEKNEFVCPSKKNILSIAWIMGFRKLQYTDIIDKLVSEALMDCAGDRYIYFSLDDFQYNKNSNNIICFTNNTADNNILAKIPLTFGKYSVIIDNTCGSLAKTRVYNGPVTIKRIHVILYDKYGNIIDLNEMDFSFTLEFEILYEGFNFDNVNY
jgi:hypothetical protein